MTTMKEWAVGLVLGLTLVLLIAMTEAYWALPVLIGAYIIYRAVQGRHKKENPAT